MNSNPFDVLRSLSPVGREEGAYLVSFPGSPHHVHFNTGTNFLKVRGAHGSLVCDPACL